MVRQICFHPDDPLERQIEALARKQGVTPAFLVKEIVRAHLRRHGQGPAPQNDRREFARKATALPAVVEYSPARGRSCHRQIAIVRDLSFGGLRISLPQGGPGIAGRILRSGAFTLGLRMPDGTSARFACSPCRVSESTGACAIGARITDADTGSHRALHKYLVLCDTPE